MTKVKEKDTAVLNRIIASNSLIKIFDVETTGKSNLDRIIQFSGVTLNPVTWEIVDSDSFYVNVGRKLSQTIIDITGITDEQLEQEGIPESEAYQRIHDFLGEEAVSGYNVSFDIGKVNTLFADFDDMYSPVNVIDVYKMVKELCDKSKTENQRLGTMVNHFNLAGDLTFHNAIDDVIATARLMKHLYYTKMLGQDYDMSQKLGSSATTAEKAETNVRRSLPIVISSGNEKVNVIRIVRWKKSEKIDRIYCDYRMQDSSEGRAYFDLISRQYLEDPNSDLLKNIDLADFNVQVFDLILLSGVWEFSAFEGSFERR